MAAITYKPYFEELVKKVSRLMKKGMDAATLMEAVREAERKENPETAPAPEKTDGAKTLSDVLEGMERRPFRRF